MCGSITKIQSAVGTNVCGALIESSSREMSPFRSRMPSIIANPAQQRGVTSWSLESMARPGSIGLTSPEVTDLV